MNAVCESIDASLDARDRPLLSVRGLTRLYGPEKGCQEVDFDLYPGEVLGIVGESGSGKSTLLSLLSGRCPPDAGTVAYRDDGDRWLDLYAASEAERRTLLRTEWGFVEQNPRDGLRMGVSAGANIGERLMAQGVRHYGRLRQAGLDWLEQVEIDPLRIDDLPRTFPAACSSACRSPATWSRRHAWCSWTNPPAASTCRCRRACSTCCAAWCASWTWRW